MYKKLVLFLGIFAVLAANSLAQNTTTKRSSTHNEVKRLSGLEADLARYLEMDDEETPDPLARPRYVKVKAAAVKSSVVVNASTDERTAFDLINDVRRENGLQPLVWNDEIAAISRVHSQNMAEYSFFSHKGLDSKMVSDRADELGSRQWRAIGENIAFNRGFQDPISKAVDLWLDSPSHRRNLLDPNWKESAVGIAVAGDGSYYLTQVFWVRK
jgi:uncharacterized protein YkwD